MTTPQFAQRLGALSLALNVHERADAWHFVRMRQRVQSTLDTASHATTSAFGRCIGCPVALTAHLVNGLLEPLAVPVDYAGAIASKVIGYTLGLTFATVGALAGLLVGDAQQRCDAGFLFTDTLAYVESCVSLPLQALPVTLVFYGFALLPMAASYVQAAVHNARQPKRHTPLSFAQFPARPLAPAASFWKIPTRDNALTATWYVGSGYAA